MFNFYALYILALLGIISLRLTRLGNDAESCAQLYDV